MENKTTAERCTRKISKELFGSEARWSYILDIIKRSNHKDFGHYDGKLRMKERLVGWFSNIVLDTLEDSLTYLLKNDKYLEHTLSLVNTRLYKYHINKTSTNTTGLINIKDVAERLVEDKIHQLLYKHETDIMFILNPGAGRVERMESLPFLNRIPGWEDYITECPESSKLEILFEEVIEDYIEDHPFTQDEEALEYLKEFDPSMNKAVVFLHQQDTINDIRDVDSITLADALRKGLMLQDLHYLLQK